MKSLIVLLMLWAFTIYSMAQRWQELAETLDSASQASPATITVTEGHWDVTTDTLNWSELTDDSASVGYAEITISDMQPDTLKVEWLGDIVYAKRDTFIYRTWNDNIEMYIPGVMSKDSIQVGLREDGVVVWRRIK